MRLRESQLAAADLDAIYEFGVTNHGIDAALAYLDQIEQRYRQLLAYPGSGRADNKLASGLRSISCGSHRIYYEIEGDLIIIQRILHQAMDAAWHFG